MERPIPYIVIAVVLAAALDGIKRKLDAAAGG